MVESTAQANPEKLKVLISVDMEGICGVTQVEHVDTARSKKIALYKHGQTLMTAETNAVIKGCQEAGATEIVVADAHWHG